MSKFKLLYLFIFILSTTFSFAQTAAPYQDFTKHPRVYTHRHSFWFEGNFNGTIHRTDSGRINWQYQVDYQYRRSSDADYVKNGNTNNFLKDMQQNVFRPWIHYWPFPGKLRLSVSPIGHWGTWTPPAEGAPLYFTEYRSTYQLTLFHKLHRIDIQQRWRYEFRFIANSLPTNNHFNDLFTNSYFAGTGYKNRLRYMVRVNCPLKKNGAAYFSLWDEVFFGIGRNTASNRIFDQNRLVGLIGRKSSTNKYPMKVEIGFTWQVAPKYNMNVPPTQDASYGSFMKSNWENNLALQVYLILDETHKLRGFRKNKKDENRILQ